jgi:MFS family permease
VGERVTGISTGRGATPIKPRRIRRIQFTTLSFLMLAGIVNFLDRSSLSIANTTIRAELHLSGTQIGALLSAFSFAYGLAQLPTGPLLDRFGTRSILGAAMGVWSLAQMATGIVRGFGSFILLRVGLGLGEAPFLPAGVKAVNDWFAVEDRGRAMSAVNMSSTLGLAIAPPLLTAIMLAFGWRRMFLIIGGLGLALAAAWYPLNHDRADARLTEKEADYLADGRDIGGHAANGISLAEWLGLFRLRTVWGMMLGFGGINYTAWLYLAWLPGYLQTARHVTLARSGWLAAIPFLAGSLGMAVNGVVADRLVRSTRAQVSTQALMRSRKLLIVSGMGCSAACTFVVTHAATAGGAVFAISMALFFIHFAGTSGWGLVQVASPAGIVASVGAIQNFGSFVCASIAPVLTGFILDHTHSFTLALTICGSVTVAGALSYIFIVKEPIRSQS